MQPERVALVLSGGGLRGGAHVGVLKVLERVRVLKHISVVAGASAGSIVGAILASGTSVAGIERAVSQLQTASCNELLDINAGGLREAVCRQDFGRFNGLLGGQAITDLVERNLTHIRRFSDYATLPPDMQDKVKDLLLVGVNLNTGHKTVFCDTSRYPSYDEGAVCGQLSFAEGARASSSEPAIITPFVCPHENACSCGQTPAGAPNVFIDGAVRESCPLKLVVCLAGCTRVLAVNLGYAGDRVENIATQGLAEILSQTITIMATQHFESDVSYLKKQVAEGDQRLSAYVLNPQLYDMGTFAFDRLPEAVQRGEQAAEWFLQEVDRQLHIFNPDGTVDIERLFGQQGVFLYNYPDPEREGRRQRLMEALKQPEPPKPCRVEQELLRLVLLALAAVASISLVLFTLGGLLALRLKPNAASFADIFVFWDGGIVLLLIGWLVLFLLLRWRSCGSAQQ